MHTFTDEVTSALIAVSGVFLSALVSLIIARLTAALELKKLERSWEHDTLVSSVEEYAAMAAAVSICTMDTAIAYRREALTKIAALRIKESGEMAAILDDLYASVHTENYRQIDIALKSAIDQRRILLDRQKNKCPLKRFLNCLRSHQ